MTPKASKVTERKTSEDKTKQMHVDSVDESSDDESSPEDHEEDADAILLSDIDSDAGEQDVDVVPYIKLHKDNHAALNQALLTFALPLDKLPFHVHQSITATELVTIDINDDLQRELAFYKQALDAAVEGRRNLLAEGISFSRPADYFAEMVKDDEHMEKVFHQK